MSNIPNILTKEDCPLAISVLRRLKIETQPNEGHNNPQEVDFRWKWLEEILTQMAEKLDPGCSKNVIVFADENIQPNDFPF